jgi:uncharacterized protein YprB with RNaseH-like and TPR domain
MANQYIGEWTKSEDKILKTHYPNLGMKVQQFFPNRSTDAIDHRVRRLGLKFGLFEEGEEGFLDIETTNLRADFAFMLTYCIKIRGGKVIQNKITREELLSGNFDKRLVGDLLNDLKNFKKIYTYYGSRFDVPFLRTRAMMHGYDFIPYGLLMHQDIYFLARSKFCLSRKRLDNVCDMLGIEGKTHLDGKIWMLAAIGDEKSIDYIMDHNVADVEILERAFEKIRTFAGVTRTSI